MSDVGDFEAAYLHSQPLVRARLLSLGVPDTDLEDMSHEVFLLALRQQGLPTTSPPPAGWLTQACELVALAHRRRAYRRREVPSELLEDDSEQHAAVSWTELDESSASSADRLHRALAALSAPERELLALHLTAEMPFRALAGVVGCDVKTVRKRFLNASGRLRRLLSGTLAERATPVPPPLDELGPRPRHKQSALLVRHGVQSNLAIVSVGDVMVSSWLGSVTQASVGFLAATGDALTRERGHRIAHLSVVESESPPPGLDERQRLLDIARFCKRNLAVFSFVSSPGNRRIAEQILRAMGFLVRSQLVLYGAKDEVDGAEWLVSQGYVFDDDPAVSAAVLLNALDQARALRPPPLAASV